MTTQQDEQISTTVMPWEPFSLMEQLDDEAILAELRGGTLGAYVYSFQQDGHEVTGLSKVGVDMAVSQMALKGEVIREDDVKVEWSPDRQEVFFIVKAQRFLVSKDGRELLLQTAMGAKRQEVYMKVHPRDRFGRPDMAKWEKVEDPFFFEKGMSKAARNAKRRLIPEDLIVKIVTEAAAQGKTKKVGGSDAVNKARDARRARAEAPAVGQATTATRETVAGPPRAAPPQEESETPFDQLNSTGIPGVADISAPELGKGAQALGYTRDAVFATLGVANLNEWKAKAVTATPFREALKKLEDAKKAPEEEANDLAL